MLGIVGILTNQQISESIFYNSKYSRTKVYIEQSFYLLFAPVPIIPLSKSNLTSNISNLCRRARDLG
jgi:hypothetical protein